MKYHSNLNPKEIRVLELNEDCTVVKGFKYIPFNLIDWVNKDLKKYFSDEELLNACYELDLTFDDLSRYGQDIYVSQIGRSKITTPSTYQVSEYKTNKKGNRRGYGYSTDYYSCKVPTDSCNGDIVLNILQKRFPFLNKRIYNYVETIDFNLKEFNTGFPKAMVDLPKELHTLTVEQLLNLDNISFEKKESKFSIYCSFEEFYYSFKTPENPHYPSLMISLEALIKGDWKSIENKTRKYYTDYFGGRWSNVEENYPLSKNRMQWIDEMFELPEMVELKKDIQSNIPLPF